MTERDVEGLLRWSLACMSLGAAAIHAQAAADHRGFPVHVGFFLVVAAVQSGLAAVVLRRPSVRWLAAIAAWNGAVAAVWVLSRIVGLPVEGATGVESIGFKDGIAVLLELGICAGAGLIATLPEAARRAALAAGPLASTVIAATVWGLGVSGLMATHTHDGHAHLSGGDVQSVADHHGWATRLGESSHHDGDHHETVESVDQPEHDHHADEGHESDPAPVDAHQDGHHTLAAGTATVHRHAASTESVDHDDGGKEHHDHAAAPTRADDGAVGHGHAPERGDHRHGHAPGEHPGAGERDPGDDRRGAGRLIDEVMRLLSPTDSYVPQFPITTESEVPT